MQRVPNVQRCVQVQFIKLIGCVLWLLCVTVLSESNAYLAGNGLFKLLQRINCLPLSVYTFFFIVQTSTYIMVCSCLFSSRLVLNAYDQLFQWMKDNCLGDLTFHSDLFLQTQTRDWRAVVFNQVMSNDWTHTVSKSLYTFKLACFKNFLYVPSIMPQSDK